MTTIPTASLPIIGEKALPPREVPKPQKKIKVGLIQLGNRFSGQVSDQCYLPLAAGMLEAYVKKHLAHAQDYEFLLPLYTFMPIGQAVEYLSQADLIGYGISVWNEQNSLIIAEELKKINPQVINIFGGPQIPDSHKQFRRNKTVELNPDELKRKRIHFTEDYHRAHPQIDLACHGEGERVFQMILEQMAIDDCRDKSQIRSASYLDENGQFHFNPKLARMNDQELSQTPSPYLTGIFDKLMATFPSQPWIDMYETDRGCPYACAYCDWGGATEDKVSKFAMEQIYADIMWKGEHEISYVFICNANFGSLKRDVQIAEFFAEARSKYGYPKAISTQNAKNPKPHTIQALKILEKAGLCKAAVMSQQSLNPPTCRAVRRENMKMDEYYTIQKELAAEGVPTMTDIILPMPEETYSSILEAISTLITNGQHNHIHFNILAILRNTEMGNPEYQEKYGFEIVRTKIINTHGKRNDSISGIEECQELVVATNTMSREDFVKTRVLCYMATLLYFDKLLQIPIMALHKVYDLSYSQIFQTIMDKSQRPLSFPIFAEIYKFFEEVVRGIQRGGEEYTHSLPPAYPQNYLDIWWPSNEYMFIELCGKNKLAEFYQEAEKLLVSCLEYQPLSDIIPEAVKLNQALIKLPFQTSDTELTLSYNLWEFYRAVMLGKNIAVIPGYNQYTIDRTTEKWNSWEEWYEQVVWYGNRQGAYLYGCKNPHQEISGHH